MLNIYNRFKFSNFVKHVYNDFVSLTKVLPNGIYLTEQFDILLPNKFYSFNTTKSETIQERCQTSPQIPSDSRDEITLEFMACS